LDSNFEALIERQENVKNLTEKIVKDTEALLVPNPGNRVVSSISFNLLFLLALPL
jgi:endophilin-B